MALKYPLHSLGWYGFETLAQTILKATIGPGVSAFGGSRDGGRDAAYQGVASFPSATEQWSGNWVFQVKFAEFEGDVVQGSIASIRNLFRKEAVSSMTRRKRLGRSPDNYVLITNVPLTGDDRDDLLRIASEVQVASRVAVVDGRDICGLLDIHPHIRRAFPQLLALADFSEVLNAAALTASGAYLERWRQHLSAFVATSAYHKAGAVLQKHHFLLLDGAPEAGKSTIAAALALEAAARGVEVYSIRRPEQVYQLRKRDAAQLFVADDVVGAVAVDVPVADDWSRELPNVLATLAPNGYMIWTGRTYVIGAALDRVRLGESLVQFPGAHGVTVSVGDLTPRERAGMLYSHVKRQRFPEQLRQMIRSMAREIVAHPNVTPERLRALADVVLSAPGVTSADVRQFLINPSGRWTQAYDNLSEAERAVLAAVLHHSGAAPANSVRAHYDAYVSKIGEIDTPFDTVLQRLSPGFLRITSYWKGHFDIDFAHPSVRDFVIAKHRDSEERRRRYFELASCETVGAIARALRADASGALDRDRGITPRTAAELELLCRRIAVLVDQVREPSQVRQLLQSAGELRPFQARRFSFAGTEEIDIMVPVAAADRDDAWEHSKASALLRAVVDACCGSLSLVVVDAQRPAAIESILDALRPLIAYCSPIPRVSWLAVEVLNAVRSQTAPAVARAGLLTAAVAFEPMLLESLVTAKTRTELREEMLASVERCVSHGESLAEQYDEDDHQYPDPYEFRDWRETSQRLIDVMDAFASWTGPLEPEQIAALDELRRLVQKLEEPPEMFDPDERAEEFRAPVDDWNVEEMFADL